VQKKCRTVWHEMVVSPSTVSSLVFFKLSANDYANVPMDVPGVVDEVVRALGLSVKM
jgi:hypothetical protein